MNTPLFTVYRANTGVGIWRTTIGVHILAYRAKQTNNADLNKGRTTSHFLRAHILKVYSKQGPLCLSVFIVC